MARKINMDHRTKVHRRRTKVRRNRIKVPRRLTKVLLRDNL
jgi:hypothetical protein